MTTSITPLDASNVNEGTGGSIPIGKELVLLSRAVTGGTLYIMATRGSDTQLVCGNVVFVPASANPATRRLKLTEAKLDSGAPLPSSATSTSPAISRTAGTSMVMVGAATSSSTVTTKAIWEVVLPDTYIAGAAITFTADANYTTSSGAVVGSGTTLTLTADTESDAGVEAAITVTGGAQQFTGTAATYSWTISAANAATAGLAPGSRIVFELAMAVDNTTGASTGQINSVNYTA